MADPASIIGTAVGVTSLGIQACQILSQYYSQFRDFSHDIDAVVNRAEGLSQSLEVLESLRPRVEICDSSVAKQLQFAIEKCTIGLRDLQAMATKCGENTAPVTLKDRARLLKKRMLWPLRQETLVSLRGTLDGLQANVQIAVQLLDMYSFLSLFHLTRTMLITCDSDAGDRVFRSLQITTTTVSTHSATVERLLNKQCAALGTIQQGMNDLSQGRFSTDEAARLLRESQQISSQLEDVEQKLAMLLSASQSQQLQFDSSPQRPHCSSRQALGKRLRLDAHVDRRQHHCGGPDLVASSTSTCFGSQNTGPIAGSIVENQFLLAEQGIDNSDGSSTWTSKLASRT